MIIWREAWVRNAMQWKNQPAAPRLTVVRPRKTLCQGSSRLVCAAAQEQRPLLEPEWVSGTSSESYMFCASTHIIYKVYVRIYIYMQIQLQRRRVYSHTDFTNANMYIYIYIMTAKSGAVRSHDLFLSIYIYIFSPLPLHTFPQHTLLNHSWVGIYINTMGSQSF